MQTRVAVEIFGHRDLDDSVFSHSMESRRFRNVAMKIRGVAHISPMMMSRVQKAIRFECSGRSGVMVARGNL
jgi:hypothetical protein